MKSSFVKKNDLKHCDTNSTIDITDDTDSLFEESVDAQKIKVAKLQTGGNKNIEIANIKQLPTLFFIIFLLSLAIISAQFVPSMFLMVKGNSLYQEKLNAKYVPRFFGEQSLAVKVNKLFKNVFFKI